MEEKKSLMEEWEDDELTAEQEDQKAKKGSWPGPGCN